MISDKHLNSFNNKGGSMRHIGKNALGGERYQITGMLDWGVNFVNHDKLAPMDSITDCAGEGKTVYVYACPCCGLFSLRSAVFDIGICCCKSDHQFTEEIEKSMSKKDDKSSSL